MEEDKKYYSDYPTEPIGGGNPYYRWVFCKISDPEINMRLEGHLEDCIYRVGIEEGKSLAEIYEEYYKILYGD